MSLQSLGLWALPIDCSWLRNCKAIENQRFACFEEEGHWEFPGGSLFAAVRKFFEDCWLVMFFAVLVAVIVSLIYIFVLGSLKAPRCMFMLADPQDAGVLIVCGCLIAVSILLAVLSVLLFLAV